MSKEMDDDNGHLHPCRYTADEIFGFIKEKITVVGKDYMGEILHCSACGHEWYKGMNKSDECDWCNESRETNALTRWKNSTATDGEVKS